jgi:uncharacterized damage-inducible protein DinB
MTLIEMLTLELKQEAATTRKMLERVPPEAFDWKPHDKSMSLGRLAAHVAGLHDTWLVTALTQNEFDLKEGLPFKADSVPEILEAFDQSIARAIEALRTQTDEQLNSPWRLKMSGATIFEMPRWAVMRSMVINHIIHHRGQLSVYLRLQNVPLPSVYGPTADESPF